MRTLGIPGNSRRPRAKARVRPGWMRIAATPVRLRLAPGSRTNRVTRPCQPTPQVAETFSIFSQSPDNDLVIRCRRKPMTDDDVVAARRWFAEELRYTANVRAPAVVDAFAAVPRERFLGRGPWRILSPVAMAEGYWTTGDADPRHLYHDVLVAIDERRRLNNGQPSLWAFLYDRLRPLAGAHVVHVGGGTGYFTAVLAELV